MVGLVSTQLNSSKQDSTVLVLVAACRIQLPPDLAHRLCRQLQVSEPSVFAVITDPLHLQSRRLSPHHVNSVRFLSVSEVLISPDLSSLNFSHLAWAKDEPPSPKEHPDLENGPTPESRASDVASFHSTLHPNGAPSRWWAFTLPRPSKESNGSEHLLEQKPPERKSSGFRPSKSWLPTSASAFREGSSFSRRAGEKSNENDDGEGSSRAPWNETIQLPPRAAGPPFTLAHNSTPGWETPWTSRSAAQGPRRDRPRENSYGLGGEAVASSSEDQSAEEKGSWAMRKKRLRIFILTNAYVPLVRKPPSTLDILLTRRIAFSCHQHLIHLCCPWNIPSNKAC